ncbi:peptidoglycan-binding protein [Nocardioides sambongensis]|uniref:peptidoglycan-binding protein n=1 Tax=Nocardioides sambongensis TaxID=2589074 RepID=UPI0015E836AD|nr:peptidoglycan-binding protein [Nocardioides sambongensis]
MIAKRFAGISQFERCLDGGRMTSAGFDSNGDLAVDEPNDIGAVIAVQAALRALGYQVLPSGVFDSATESSVQRFKVDQDLGLPTGLTQHDGVLGPGSSQRLNEIFLREDPDRPPASGVPLIAIQGLTYPALSPDLVSVVIHDTGGHATAEIEVLGVPNRYLVGVAPGSTTIAIHTADSPEAFNGRAVQIETRMPSDGLPSTVLLADGTAPRAGPEEPVPLRFGAEITACTARRTADRSEARCHTAAPGLAVGSRVRLILPDDNAPGELVIAEVWHRYDVAGGHTTEFTAIS